MTLAKTAHRQVTFCGTSTFWRLMFNKQKFYCHIKLILVPHFWSLLCFNKTPSCLNNPHVHANFYHLPATSPLASYKVCFQPSVPAIISACMNPSLHFISAPVPAPWVNKFAYPPFLSGIDFCLFLTTTKTEHESDFEVHTWAVPFIIIVIDAH